MKRNSAFLIIDVQNDFCPGGSLAVPEGDRVVPVINRCIDIFSAGKLPVVASRDWHPEKTSHFSQFGGAWPPHCVQGTAGAQFHPGLQLPERTIIVSKGMDPDRDDYSAFCATDSSGAGLGQLLDELGVDHLYVAGLATDYCVRESVLEALRLGFGVTVISDAVRGVDLSSGDSDRAMAEMADAGAAAETSDNIPGKMAGG